MGKTKTPEGQSALPGMEPSTEGQNLNLGPNGKIVRRRRRTPEGTLPAVKEQLSDTTLAVFARIRRQPIGSRGKGSKED